ncbi:type II CRISPR RNA-guided endonuclease Cas9 [Hydrogenimonas sp.]
MKKILAVDLGITSFGYAILQATDRSNAYRVVDNSVVMRNSPYNERGESAQKKRATFKSMRRLIEKRKKRIKCVAKVFDAFGIIPYTEAKSVNDPRKNPIKNRWELRADDAWKRPLEPYELFAIFAHMAKHRGYKSIATEDLLYELERELGLQNDSNIDNENEEKREIFRAIDTLAKIRERYRTETVAQAIHIAVQRGELRSYRNHGDYEKMIRREDIEEEIEKIVDRQAELGTLSFSDSRLSDFVEALKGCITEQAMPTIDESLFGKCAFYKEETAAPKYSLLYDLYRLYKKLGDLRIDGYAVSPEDREKVVQWVWKKLKQGKNVKKLTYKDLRKILGLSSEHKIFGQEDEYTLKGKTRAREFVKFFFISDIATFKNLFAALASRRDNLEIFAAVAELVQKSKTPKEYFKKMHTLLQKRGIDADKKELLELFKNKKPGTMALSHRYILEALPLFLEGLEEKEVQKRLGITVEEDYSGFPKSLEHLHMGIDNLFERFENPLNNHAVKSLASWALGLIADLSWRYGPFDEIVIESARDVLPEKRRREIEKAMDERQKRLEEIVKRYKKEFPTIDKRLARKIELWENQGHIDLYTGDTIGLQQLLDGSADIEHIVPRSLGGLTTHYNTIVALKDPNSEKGNRLPGDWLAADASYRNRVEALFAEGKIDWKKRKNLLARTLDEIYTENFHTKGLRATSYLEALVAQVLKRFYPFPDREARKNGIAVRTIPGRTTSRARNLLGIRSKSRETNWHHAEDALILATISRGWQNRLHRALKERYGQSDEALMEAWKEFIPHLEGLSIADYVHEAFERFMSKGEDSLFYRDMFGGIRSVSYRVDKKPLSASSHRDTVYSRKHEVPTLRKNILEAFSQLDIVKNRNTLTSETFLKKYDEEIRRKLWLHRIGNTNDESYRAVERRAAEIAETIDRFRERDPKRDKEVDVAYRQALDELLKRPIVAGGKPIRRMRFVYDRLNTTLVIDRGLVETDKNFLGIHIERDGKRGIRIEKIDINNAAAMTKRKSGMTAYLNETLFFFKKDDLIHAGCLRSFIENRKLVALFNSRFPDNPKAQPAAFSTGSQIKPVGAGRAKGVIKARLDLDGHVKSYEVIGEVTKEQKAWFEKECGYGGLEDDSRH